MALSTTHHTLVFDRYNAVGGTGDPGSEGQSDKARAEDTGGSAGAGGAGGSTSAAGGAGGSTSGAGADGSSGTGGGDDDFPYAAVIVPLFLVLLVSDQGKLSFKMGKGFLGYVALSSM